jgi:hypothetical protein
MIPRLPQPALDQTVKRSPRPRPREARSHRRRVPDPLQVGWDNGAPITSMGPRLKRQTWAAIVQAPAPSTVHLNCESRRVTAQRMRSVPLSELLARALGDLTCELVADGAGLRPLAPRMHHKRR